MAARPAKRQRRSTVIVSDDEEDVADTSHIPVRPQNTQPKNRQARASTVKAESSRSRAKTNSPKTSPSPSPQKPRRVNKQIIETQNNKSLHSFFSKVSEEQRWQRRANTPQRESQEETVVDDIVDDDSLDDDVSLSSQSHSNQLVSTSSSISLRGSRTNEARSSTPLSSQKFSRPKVASSLSNQTQAGSELIVVEETRPWADRFGPAGLDELAVHKKKVADVQQWLDDVHTGKSPQRILVLKGPAGSGKSTTVMLIAKSLSITVVSWRNPDVSETAHTSSTQQFADFLDRGGQFEALTLDDDNLPPQPSPNSERQILLVEEFPASTNRSSSALNAFRSTLLQHLVRTRKTSQPGIHVQPADDNTPVILIISETLLTSSTALSDSFTAHRLLGPEVSNHPLVSILEFNPVAPTFISKAIDIVIKKEARESKRRRTPGHAILQQLSEVGDIRSAINSLEFLCARGDDTSHWSGTVAARSKKSAKTNVSLTDVEKNALQLISQRESTLDMFHAAGKIVYNKREDPRTLDSRAEPPPKPPEHLMYLYTPKVSQVNVDALLNETGTDIQTFIATLHENYVLSCNGDDFVDAFDGCAHVLSDSDFLSPESRNIVRTRGNTRAHTHNLQSGNSDMLRQDEISFQTATRGLLFSLPFPVTRAIPMGARKQDAFKMFYPASLRLWKPAEEIDELISLYANAMTSGGSVLSPADRPTAGVASWQSRGLSYGAVPDTQDNGDNETTFIRSFISRQSLPTELLPYLTAIHNGLNRDNQILRRITEFKGINIPHDEQLDDEHYNATTNLSSNNINLQQRVEDAHNKLQASRWRASEHTQRDSVINGSTQNNDADVEAKDKMYISDDDIQDD